MKGRNRIVDIVCILIVGAFVGTFAFLNAFQTERPTVSEEEKRALATMPELSASAVFSGSYFKDFDSFISDTFIFRDSLISGSKVVKSLYGIQSGGDFQIIEPGAVETTGGDVIEIPDIVTSVPPDSGKTTDTSGGDSTAEEYPDISRIYFDENVIYMTVGEVRALNVTLEPDVSGVPVTWTSTSFEIADFTEQDGRTCVNAKKTGTVTVSASVPSGVMCSCIVHISSGQTTDDPNPPANITDEPDFISNGFVIYKDAVYANAYYVESAAKSYAEVADYYARLFPGVRVTALTGPLSSFKLPIDTFGVGRLSDQNKMIEDCAAFFTEARMVNPFQSLYAHKDEYLYFRSDHHWTNRGAYYAYQAFCDAVGLVPAQLEDMEEIVLSDSWRGSMYSYTKDQRVYQITDTVYAYLPTKEHTMTVYTTQGTSTTYSSSVVTSIHYYLAFLTGDWPYITINVPDNPQDMNIIVIKDSYGNAFVPHLCNNYGNIIVVDPRYCTYNLYEMFKDYPLTDILFVNHIYNANNASWARMLLSLVTN